MLNFYIITLLHYYIIQMEFTDKSIDINFISLDTTELSEAKIINEYIPLINNYLLEVYNIKKKIQEKQSEQNSNPTEKLTLMRNFKMIVDLISIYREPKILSLINEYKEEKEKEKLRVVEMEQLRKEMLLKRQQENTFDNNLFGNFWNQQNNNFSDDEDILSDVSEEDLDKDKVSNMLNDEYTKINTNSMLRKTYNIEKRNYCDFDEDVNGDGDEDVNSNDAEDGNQS
jgi:hypothetical protein